MSGFNRPGKDTRGGPPVIQMLLPPADLTDCKAVGLSHHGHGGLFSGPWWVLSSVASGASQSRQYEGHMEACEIRESGLKDHEPPAWAEVILFLVTLGEV